MKKMYLSAAFILSAALLSAQNARDAFEKQREARNLAIQRVIKGESLIDFKEVANSMANKQITAHKTSSSAARPDSIREFIWTGTQYDYSGYHKFIYFPNLKPLEVTTYYDMGGGNHEAFTKIVYNYAASGRIGQIETFNITNNVPVLDTRFIFNYDAQNRLTLQKVYFFDQSQNIIDILADSIVITNNAQNQAIKYTAYAKLSINDPYAINLELGDIVYDAATSYEKEVGIFVDPIGTGMLIKFQEAKDLKWNLGYAPFISLFFNPEMIAESSHPFYNLYPSDYFAGFGPSDGLINMGFPILEPMLKITSTLQASKVTAITFEEYDGSGWFNTERNVYTYNTINKVATNTYEEDLGMGWEQVSRTLLDYDAEGHQSKEYELEYLNNAWDTIYGDHDIRQFDAQKRMIEMEEVGFDPNMGMNPFSKFEFFYGNNIGINEWANNSLNIYPNPANERLFVLSEEELNATISLMDLTGRVVYTTQAQLVEGAPFEVNTQNLARGTYILSLQNKLQVLSTQKVVLR